MAPLDQCKYAEMTDCPFYVRCSEGKPCMHDVWKQEDFNEYLAMIELRDNLNERRDLFGDRGE